MRFAAFATPILLLAGAPCAQGVALTVLDSQPVAPGQTISVQVTNNTTQGLATGGTNDLVVALRASADELIAPEFVGCGPLVSLIPPGQSTTVTMTAPSEPGTHVLVGPDGNTTLDVMAASSVPAFHSYPIALKTAPSTRSGHRVAFPPSSVPNWEIANVSGTSQTIPGGVLRLFPPGSTTPVAMLNITGLTVPAHGALQISLPLAGLTPGPYTVETLIADPTGSARFIRHGIQPATSQAFVDLHFPEGRRVPRSGSVRARMTMGGFFVPGLIPPPTTTLVYFTVLGYTPGSFAFGGSQVPIAGSDPLLAASLTSGIGGLIGSYSGQPLIQSVYCAHSTDLIPTAESQINNPNIPAIMGLVFRAAAICVDTADGTFGTSQSEDVTFL